MFDSSFLSLFLLEFMAFQVCNRRCSFRMASIVCPAHFSDVYISLYFYILSFFELFHLPESIIQKVDHLNTNAFVCLSSVERKNNKITLICFHTSQGVLKDVRAHCYCASLVRTLFIGHPRATSFSSARTESKTQQNIELMTSALTWCANISVGCSVTPTFFSADHFLF